MPDRIRLAIALCAVFLALVGCQSQEEQRAEHAQRAAEYYDAEQWNEAKIEYLNLLQLSPDDGEANFRLGEVQRRLGEYADSLWRYREAVRLDPQNPEWRARLAAMLIAAQRIDEAREHADAALAIDPENIEALLLRARIHGHETELDRMLERLQTLLELTHGTEDQELKDLQTAAYALKVQAHLQRQESEQAESTLRQFTAAQDKPGPHLLLAVFLTDRDRPDEAEVEYRAAIDSAETEEQRLRAQFGLAGFLNGRGQLDAAEQVLREAGEQAPEREEPLLQLARFYESHDRSEEAEATLEVTVERRPDEAAPLLLLSNFHRQSGNPEKALEAVDRALVLEPELERARLMRAEYLMAQREERPELGDEASFIVAEVLEENPDSLLGLLTSGKFLLIEGRNEDATNALRRVVQEQPSAPAHLMLATAYRNMGQRDLARSELLAAIQLEDTNLVARQMLAHIYFEAGNYGLAVQESEAALRRQNDLLPMLLLRAQALGLMRQRPEAQAALDAIEFGGEEHDPLRLRAATMYFQLGLPDDGTRHVMVVLERDPANADALRLLVTKLTRAGQTDAAMARIEQAIAINADDAELYELRAAVTLAKGAPAGGADALKKAVMGDLDRSIEKAPERAEPHILRGRILQMAGEPDEADVSLRRAIEIDPSNPVAYILRAEMLTRQGRGEEAKQVYEALLRSHPEHVGAKNNLAWLLASADSATPADLDRAQSLAQDAKEASPDNSAISDTLGWVMLKKRIPRAAVSLFREAVAKAPNSYMRATARYHLALAYEQTGDADKAIAELELALAEDENFADRGEAAATLERLRTG